jgi:hypothetical protein
MVELLAMNGQADLDVAETLSIGQLGESHGEKLLPTGELSNATIAIVTLNAAMKFVVRNVMKDLGENGLTAVHSRTPFSVEWLKVLPNRYNFKSFKPFFVSYALMRFNLFGFSKCSTGRY